jgi:hypothetical protein
VARDLPEEDLVDRLQSLGFPPPCYPNYGAPFLPRQVYLLLNTPAFAGHTTVPPIVHPTGVLLRRIRMPHSSRVLYGARKAHGVEQ